MAYNRKLWVDRESEFPNQRLLSPVDGGTPALYAVDREEGIVFEEGDIFNAANMNDLELRVLTGFTGLESQTDNNLNSLEQKLTNSQNSMEQRLTSAQSSLQQQLTSEIGKKLTASTAPGNTGGYYFVIMNESNFTSPSNPTWSQIPSDKRINGAILAIRKGK